MTTSADDVLKQALELNEPERARLVTELLSTLEPDSATGSLSDSEWIAEIERRARAAHAGRPGVPWDEARKRIEDRFHRE
jgi:putative addiction module component (TIGR02574 family)